MIDHQVLRWLGPLRVACARALVRLGATADGLTWLAFGLGLLACLAVAHDALGWGLGLMLLSRAIDGLDGAVARQTQATDRGAFLDIACDFMFYALFVLAFAWRNPQDHALPAAVLLASFMGTGATFLAFATQAAKRGMTSVSFPDKGFYFLGGLAEGSETIACFALMCLWPAHFAWWAYGFAVLCGLTAITRLLHGWRALR